MSSPSFLTRPITAALVAALLVLAALAPAAGGAQAAPPGPAAASPSFWVTDGPVHSAVLSGDGRRLYIGGKFMYVGPQTGSLVALNATTAATQTFPLVNGEVKAIASDGSGGWYIGGNFLSVVDTQGPNRGVVQPRTRLAHITSGNTVDPNWKPLASGTVSAIAVRGSTVYVGGGFCYVGDGPAPRSHLAALDASTGAALSWNPGVGGPACGSDNATVKSLALSDNGATIYVGGTFASAGGQPRNNLAALSTSTGAALSWNPNPDNSVLALLLSGNTLYAGGTFKNVGSPPVANTVLAAFDTATGGLAAGWSNPRIHPSVGASPDIYVHALAISGGTLYFAGLFDNVGVDGPQVHDVPVDDEPTFRDDLAAVDATTGVLLPWYVPPHSDTGAAIYAIALSADASTLYLGGAFEWIGGYYDPGPGVARSRLAAVSTYDPANPSSNVGQIVKASWSPYTNGAVEALAVSGSTVYAGGLFTSVGGRLRRNLAALDTATGEALATWNAGTDSTVYALALSGTTLYAAGAFTHIGSTTGTPRSSLAAFDSSGNLLSWDPSVDNTGGTGPAVVNALALSGTTLYAGGTFTHIGGPGGAPRDNLAAIDTSTGQPSAWNPRVAKTGGTDAPVVNTLVVSGTTLYAGGAFTHIGGPGGAPRNNLAAIDTSTGQVSAWNPDPDGAVHTVALSADRTVVFAGGRFTHMGGPTGAPRGYLAALSADPAGGGALLPWNPNVSHTAAPPNTVVDALTVYGDTVYVGGIFSSAGGVPLSSRHLTAVHAATGSVLSWAPTTDSATTSITVSGDGSIVYAGFSTIPNQVGIIYFTALEGFRSAPSAFSSGAPPRALVGDSYSFDLAADGTPAPTYSVTAGSLPPGLQLDAAGRLHGTPSAAGSYQFTVTASNSAGQHSQALTVVVDGPIFLPLIGL